MKKKSASLKEKTSYNGWLPMDDEVDDTPTDAARLHLEALEAIRLMVKSEVNSQHGIGLQEILGGLHALSICYKTAHWLALGKNFYGDHLLFQRLYEDISDEIDSVAERMVGMMGDAAIADMEPIKLLSVAAKIISSYPKCDGQNISLLDAEKMFQASIISVLKCSADAPGLENLLQGIADKHDEHLYLLQQREKQTSITACVQPSVSEAKKKKKLRSPKTWNIGGPISTGPGNQGFGSSGGGSC